MRRAAAENTADVYEVLWWDGCLFISRKALGQTRAGSIAAECHLLGAAELQRRPAPCIFCYWKVIFMRVNNSSSGLGAFCSFTRSRSIAYAKQTGKKIES